MVLKPSETALISGLIRAEVCHDAGIPVGVFNLINGDGPSVGQVPAGHRVVDMASFAGAGAAGVVVASEARFNKRTGLIEAGVAEGATLVCGGPGRMKFGESRVIVGYGAS